MFSQRISACCVLGLSSICCRAETGLVLGYTEPAPVLVTNGGGSDPGPAVTPPGLDAAASDPMDSGSPVVIPEDAGTPITFESVCRPTVVYNNFDPNGAGATIDVRMTDPPSVVQPISATACSLLYSDPESVKLVEEIEVIAEPLGVPSAVSTGRIRLSSTYFDEYAAAGGDVTEELLGVLHFAVSINYQYNAGGSAPSWLVTGIADFVRLNAGHFDPNGALPGGSWTDGFRTTAYFFDWVATSYPDIVVGLHAALAPGQAGYSDALFVQLTGRTVNSLWAEYQAAIQ